MRIVAQVAMAGIAAFLALTWKYALLLPLLWPVFMVAVTPIAWYVVFDRHREAPNDEVIQRLDMLINAVHAVADRGSTALPVRR